MNKVYSFGWSEHEKAYNQEVQEDEKDEKEGKKGKLLIAIQILFNRSY